MSLHSRLMEDGGACQPRGWGIVIWTTWLTDGFLLAWAFCLILWDRWGVGDIFTTLGYPQTCSDVVSVKCVPLLPRSYEHYTPSIKQMDLAESAGPAPAPTPQAVLDIKENLMNFCTLPSLASSFLRPNQTPLQGRGGCPGRQRASWSQ